MTSRKEGECCLTDESEEVCESESSEVVCCECDGRTKEKIIIKTSVLRQVHSADPVFHVVYIKVRCATASATPASIS